ncbi:hypothetical protein [Antarcticirhabdus aurantiaca]|uniref:Uncharacterized protein n=1 Tax=Antarcticirhabdus aurantiaca TaxID=2606717 RepID=A0ACD4NI01_9HYPH|nr:hypothetical protein [Antarcticirhabdus aurantiaca]WAJ26411.1 hypothetical protein OXU80_16085 [Jeongeuplla avenae]
MLVYGDHRRDASLPDLLAQIANGAAKLEGRAGLSWHGACFDLLRLVSELLQGWADAERERRGIDETSPGQDRIAAAAVEVARALDRSWRSGFADQPLPDLSMLAGLDALDPPAALTLRGGEGFDFYAVYPELYLSAARRLPSGAVVIGLRSIGAALAPLVAAASSARLVVTLRPVGHPFQRRVEVGPDLRARLLADPRAVVAIVDEGPGLSGSSFGGVADWLEAEGVPRDRIVFMPSHGGEPGREASAEHRARWQGARRLHAPFEDVILAGTGEGEGTPLARWFADLSGEVCEPELQDLSGGLWRGFSPWVDAPVDPGREARKYRLEAGEGAVLLKFVGFGPDAEAKFERARALFDAGFSPEPLALRHGFLAERWVEGARWTPQPAEAADHLARYLGFRSRTFPADRAGADLVTLAEMARYNLGQCIGTDAAAALLGEWTEARIADLQALVRPVFVDARLHPWEWIATPRGVVKTDAVDHARAHDLVGCQDIAWDVAGASVEFGLDPEETVELGDCVSGRGARELIRFMRLAYLGFQAGWWSYASGEGAPARREFYVAEARACAWNG